MALEETIIQISDLDEASRVLAACQTYFAARDLSAAQVEFRQVRPSPISLEVEKIRTKLDAYMGDFLLAQHRGELEEAELAAQEDPEGAEDGSEDVTEASEEPLPDKPLGEFTAPKQKGRRLKADEV